MRFESFLPAHIFQAVNYCSIVLKMKILMFWFSRLDLYPVLKLKKKKKNCQNVLQGKIFFFKKGEYKCCHDSFRQILIQQQPASDAFKVIDFRSKILSHF